MSKNRKKKHGKRSPHGSQPAQGAAQKAKVALSAATRTPEAVKMVEATLPSQVVMRLDRPYATKLSMEESARRKGWWARLRGRLKRGDKTA